MSSKIEKQGASIMQLETEAEIPAESIFEGLHIRRRLLEKFVEDPSSLDPEDRLIMNSHFHLCPGNKCQKVIDEIIRADKREDRKLSQLPEGDR